MNNYRTQKKRNEQSGAVLPLIAICFALLLMFAAMAIDLGYLFVGRNELQNAADAAALAATRQIGVIYNSMSQVEQSLYQANVANEWKEDDGDGVYYDHLTLVNTAVSVALQNTAAQEDIVIDPSNVLIGVWDPENPAPDTFTADTSDQTPFNQTYNNPTAVRVRAIRDVDNFSGPIATFFSGFFGEDRFPVMAIATASLTGQGSSAPGELQLPIGLSRKWFEGTPSDWCGNVVKFSPPSDPDACAGWTGFDLEKATKNQLDPILSGEHEVPETEKGDDFYYTNGVVVSDIFKHLLVRFGMEGYDVDRIYEYDPNKDYAAQEIPQEVTDASQRVPLCYYNGALVECNPADVEIDNIHLRYPNLDFDNMDGGNQQKNFTGPYRYAHEWETTMVVYDSYDCTPSQDIPIYGYARVVLYDVGPPDNAYVYARITCDIVDPEPSRGGGGYLGLYGSIPQLVE